MNQVEVKRKQIQDFSYIIGLVTLLILGRTLGDEGIAYLAAAVEGVSFFTVLLASSTPDILGRLLRGRIQKGQYRNAARLRKNIMIFQGLLGLIAGVLVTAGAGFLADYIFRVPYSTLALRILGPVVFLRVTAGVLLGYFQGSGTEMPTAVYCVLRQIFLLGFGFLFSNISSGYGKKVSALLRKEEFTSMYGVAGIAAAMVLTEVLLVLFLLLIYMGSRKKQREQTAEGMKKTDSFFKSVSVFYGAGMPFLLVNLLAKLPVWLGFILYQRSAAEGQELMADYGIYYGKYLLICAFFLLLFGALQRPCCSRVAVSLRRDEQRLAKEIFQSAVHLGTGRALFCAVWIATLAEQLAGALFQGNTVLTAQLLRGGSLLVLFGIPAVFFLRMLQRIGKTSLALCGAGLYSAVFIVGSIIGLFAAKGGIAALVYAAIAAAAATCAGAGWLAFRQFHAKFDVISVAAVPAAAAGVMGIVCMLIAKAATPHLGNGVTALVCLIVGLALYWGALLLLHNYRRQELEQAGGRILLLLGDMLRCF